MLRNVSLEMSLKPFFDVSDQTIDAVCRTLFRQWSPLLRDARGVSVLLWTADGSEILDYKGDIDAAIEWGRYIGGVNPKWNVPGDPQGKALHSRCYLYRDEPAAITYRDLGRIVSAIKRIGHEMTGLPVRVGETFDPGCEFAKSPFKYERHNEICMANTGGPKSFACCYAVLDCDTEPYATYPDGIPDNTPLGVFLGKQAQRVCDDVGFDYLWLSNGFGYGLETWMTRGPMFDGREFKGELAPDLRDKTLSFWKEFQAEFKLPVETRGTNLSTGIDLASDGVPLREIYQQATQLQPPPNSPWAALNGDFGLELTGFMSHIAELPAHQEFPFRYYTHDPWWLNSPWLDRYGRQPHDIYMPLSVSRIDGKGHIRTPDSILFLTADDSYGHLPDQVPAEVIPHIQEARRRSPDAPGAVTWVYPFDEYHDLTFSQPDRVREPFFGDWFIRSAINNGLPLNTVVSTTNFLQTRVELYRESVLLTTVPDAGSAMTERLKQHVATGGKVLLYGPTDHADAGLLAWLGLTHESPIAGTLGVTVHGEFDSLSGQAYPTSVEHREIMCAGGCSEVIADAQSKPLAEYVKDGQRRVAALVRSDGKGLVAWVRGTNASDYIGGDLISGRGHLPTADDPAEHFHADVLMRFALAKLGTSLTFAKRDAAQRNPITTISRHGNGYFFSGFVPDMTVELRFKLPQGAPVFTGYDTQLVDGRATYRMSRAWERECLVFVEQAKGVVSCIERCAEMIGVTRRLRVIGLQDAVVRVYVPGDAKPEFTINAAYPYFEGPFAKQKSIDNHLGRHFETEPLTGELVISW